MTERKKHFIRKAAAGVISAAAVYSMAVTSFACTSPDANASLVTVTEMWRCESAGQARAAAPCEHEPEAHPDVYISGEKFEGYVFINKGTTYVPLRSLAAKLGEAEVLYNDEDRGAVITLGDKTESFAADEGFVIDARMYVPVRRVAEFFGMGVRWSAPDFAVYIEPVAAVEAKVAPSPAAPKYTEDELYWLSRIIHAEAKGESMTGKIAVGNVVLNRVESDLFPATIYGVIFDFKDGVQFTPAANGSVYETPSAESVEAARQCLSGVNVVGNALFFMNSKIAQSTWIASNRDYIMTIGNHEFYA